MNRKQISYRFITTAAALALSLLLAACGAAQAEPTLAVDDGQAGEALASIVSATGVIVPRQSAALSFSVAGVVAEVFVGEGDQVTAGQPLVRLAGGDPQNPGADVQAAILRGELEVDSAQKALDDLDAAAKAVVLQAQQVLTSAAGQIRDLQYRLAELELPESQADLTPLEAYDAALAAYQAAEAAFAPYRQEANTADRRERLADLDDAKEDYDIAVNRLQISLALQTVETNRDQARVDLEKYRSGPPETERALAEGRLESAQAGLEAARAALASMTLVAPFSGTVTQVNIRTAEWVVPGVPLVTLADLSEFHIETTDLNEIDMVQIAVGDPVQVSFDALPEQMFSGQVTAIASQALPGAGVNYPVRITLDAAPAGLRWGMSAFVDILPRP